MVCAWYGGDSLDDRLLSGLRKSAALNAPLTPLQVMLFKAPGLSKAGDRFLPKVATWRNALHAAHDGDVLLFVDADCLILKEVRSLEQALSQRYVIAHAPRAGRYPYNVGVVAVRKCPLSVSFMDGWVERTKWHAATPERIRAAKYAHGSTDQAAFADMLETIGERFVLELPDKVWNLCQDWERLDETTRIVHYRGKCSRRLLKGSSEYPKRMTDAFRKYVLCDTQ